MVQFKMAANKHWKLPKIGSTYVRVMLDMSGNSKYSVSERKSLPSNNANARSIACFNLSGKKKV